VPEALHRYLARDGDGGGVEQLTDPRPGEGDAGHGAVVGVDEHARPAAGSAGVLLCARETGRVVVHHLHPAPGTPRFVRAETDGGDLGGGQDGLGHGRMVGGGDVRAPPGVVAAVVTGREAGW
jgi:hypothetical protein